MGISGVKAGKAIFTEVSKRLPGQSESISTVLSFPELNPGRSVRDYEDLTPDSNFCAGTPKAVDHRWQYLNSKYKNGKLTNKSASSPPSVTTTPKTLKRSSPLKGKGKKVAFSQSTTPGSSPAPSDDGLAIEGTSLSPQRSSTRKAARKNYAEFDMCESDENDDDGTGETVFEDVEIKTEV
ncbi:uncharacterized protein J3D65DRAFT_20537 [Phyllosticta citribraziliensis]|uniref:Uncharacterized protein n=1 Tax=Phyllosticta citribraziliensis TaxID=989973 RepID=A0ABR1MB39_9PEZI